MTKYFPAQIAPGIVGLVSIPIFTRLFTPGDYGNYVLVMATVSVMAAMVGWLSMSIIRFYTVYEMEGHLQEFYSTVIRWLIISVLTIALIFVGVIILIKNVLENQLYRLMLVGTLVFIFTACFQVLAHFLRAKRKVGLYSGFFVWKSMAGLGIGIALVLVFGMNVEGLLWGTIFGVLLAFPFLWKPTIGTQSAKGGTSSVLTKEMVKYSIPLVIGNLAALILSLSDRYILEFFRGAHEVGIYSASYFISEKSIFLIASLFSLSSFPISVIVWEKEGEQKSQDFISSVTRYYLLLCVPAVVGLSILSRPIIEVFTGVGYQEGFRIMPFVALGGLLFGIEQRYHFGFVFYKKTHFIMTTIVLAGLINVVLNLLFVPRYGYMAASVTTLIGYGVLLIIMVISSRRYFVWDFPFKSLVRAAIASSIMGVVVYFIIKSLKSYTLINLFLGICVGIVVYILTLFFLKEPQKKEIQLMLEIKDKIRRRICK